MDGDVEQAKAIQKWRLLRTTRVEAMMGVGQSEGYCDCGERVGNIAGCGWTEPEVVGWRQQVATDSNDVFQALRPPSPGSHPRSSIRSRQETPSPTN